MSISKEIKKVKIGQKKVVIIFNDDDKLEISPNTYTEYNLFPKKQLSKSQIKEIKAGNEIEQYNSYALKLLSAKAYSENALRDKLVKKGANEDQIEAVIKLLIKYQLLDDSNVIKEYLEYADYKHYGYNRIKEDLIKKGIPLYKIEKIKYDDARESRLAVELIPLLEKKYSKYNYFQLKKHCYDNLLRYGYSHDIIENTLIKLKPLNEKHEKELLKIDYQKALKKYSQQYKGYELNEKVKNNLIQKGYRYIDIKEIN